MYASIPDLTYTGHTGEIDDFYTALENGTRPMIIGEDGRKTVELITAIYKAGCRREYVYLPLQADDPWYTQKGIMEEAIHFYEKTGHVENFKAEAITLGNHK